MSIIFAKISTSAAKRVINGDKSLEFARQMFKTNNQNYALAICKDIIRDDPLHLAAYELACEIYLSIYSENHREDILELIEHFERFDNSGALNKYKLRSLKFFGTPEEAVEFAKSLVANSPENKEYLELLLETAMEYSIEELSVNTARALYVKFPNKDTGKKKYADVMRFFGQVDEAASIGHELIRKESSAVQAYLKLASIKTYVFNENEIAHMETLCGRVGLGMQDRLAINYSLGKAYEDFKEFDLAFKHFKQANDIKVKANPYLPELVEANMRSQLRNIDDSFYSKVQGSGCDDIGPIFIVGLHRSGSTLVEQILSSHSCVGTGAELDCVMQIACNFLGYDGKRTNFSDAELARQLKKSSVDRFRSLGEIYIKKTNIFKQGKMHFIDKMPRNFLSIPLILSILPNAKIIDVRRDPRSVGVSIFRHNLPLVANHANRFFDIGHYYKHYVELMRHWETVFENKIHRVSYEKLVENPETEVRSMLQFCNLAFEESCLKQHENHRMVKTPSSAQVRLPIYKSGIEEWRNYSKYLSPLYEGLDES